MAKKRFILVGDAGGTNARFGIVEEGSLTPVITGCRKAAAFDSLEQAIESFLSNEAREVKPSRACIAVACPVTEDFVNLTNNHWEFYQSELQTALTLEKLIVINDFTAMALAVPHLNTDEISTIGRAILAQEREPIAVLGPGTGLGVCGLIPLHEKGWAALCGEGGHMTLAPETEREIEIMRLAQRQYGRVSVERILCGAGLSFLYRAICEIQGITPESLADADITHRALVGNSSIARETILQFCAFLGSFAGDVALLLGARGGVYIAGGIIPRLGTLFEASPFRERFENKGRFGGYVRKIPTFLISPHDDPALIGAASVFL